MAKLKGFSRNHGIGIASASELKILPTGSSQVLTAVQSNDCTRFLQILKQIGKDFVQFCGNLKENGVVLHSSEKITSEVVAEREDTPKGEHASVDVNSGEVIMKMMSLYKCAQ